LFPEFDGYSLSLGGTALAALTHFLERHSEIEKIIVCTDNDEAGELAASKIAELATANTVRLIPPFGKDWNERLQALQKAERLQNRSIDKGR
jgi:DNA primase